MGISEAEAFSERLKRELLALEAANVHAILETELLIDEVLQGLETASICVDDMDEWLCIFNVKLRHMREDIESIETGNNKLEMQYYSNKLLTEELDNLLNTCIFLLSIQHILDGSFGENHLPRLIEACEWLSAAMHRLEVPNVDPAYAPIRAVCMLHFKPFFSDYYMLIVVVDYNNCTHTYIAVARKCRQGECLSSNRNIY